MARDTRLSPFRYQSISIEAITPTWCMVVAMVGQIVPVTYWWSCVAYSGLLKVAKSVTGSFFSWLGRFNRGSESARAGSNTSVVPVSYSCRTKIVLAVVDRQRSGVKATIWQIWAVCSIGKECSVQCDLGFSNDTPKKGWGEIAYPFPNINSRIT